MIQMIKIFEEYLYITGGKAFESEIFPEQLMSRIFKILGQINKNVSKIKNELHSSNKLDKI